MWKDPIVEEIHSIRRKIAKECHYDLKQIVDRLRKKEEAHKERLVFSKREESVGVQTEVR